MQKHQFQEKIYPSLFWEDFDNETGEGGQMDDNMRFQKEIRSKK